jgi:hypothetical protein
MKQKLTLAGVAIVLTLLATPSWAQENTETGPPLEFDLPSSYIPSPGLCRIFYPRAPEESSYLQSRGCKDIEYAINVADLGAVILFRPKDGSRNFRVCWMSRSENGVIDGIDLFSVDKKRLIKVILPKIRRTAENTQKCDWNPEG